MITGLNHITIAISDIDASLLFYQQVLGFKAHVKWNTGAYLSLGELWICLSLDNSPSDNSPSDSAPSKAVSSDKATKVDDYSHIAFSVAAEDFSEVAKRIHQSGATEWQDNKSEGESLYFLDPDDHKLEIHVGNLQQRLNSLRQAPYDGLEWLSKKYTAIQ